MNENVTFQFQQSLYVQKHIFSKDIKIDFVENHKLQSIGFIPEIAC
jgi:hypothetical protein